MKKIIKMLLAPFAVLSLALGVSISVSSQNDIVVAKAYYPDVVTTWDFTTKATSSSTYTEEWTYDNYVNVYGAANNNKQWAYLRVGGKKGAGTGFSYLSSVNASTAPVGQIDIDALNIASGSGFTMDSIILTVASDSAFSTVTDTVDGGTVAAAMVFTPTSGSEWGTGSYFKLSFSWTSTTTSNRGMDVETVTFYEPHDSTVPNVSINELPLNLNAGASGTLTATTANADGNEVVWTSDNACVSINPSTGAYTTSGYGSATITATLTVGGTDYSHTGTIVVNGIATIAQAIATSNSLASEATTLYKVTLTGTPTITEIASASITVSDGTDSIMIYGGYDWVPTNMAHAIIGGRMSVTGNIQNYKGTPEIVVPTVNSYTDDVQDLATSILIGDTEGQCVTRFADYKETVLNFTTDELNKFQTSTFGDIPAARARYLAWAINQNENPYSAEPLSGTKLTNNNSRNNLVAVISIGAIGLTFILGYYFVSKKKKLS
jgi:hypothetical protein